MTVNVTGFAAYQTFTVGSGTSYVADSSGTVTGVPTNSDLRDLINDGGVRIDSSATPSANGLYTMQLPLLTGKNADGTTLAATASSGKFGLAMTAGTSEVLLTEAANSNTKTDTAAFEFVLPRTYVAASNITVTVNAQYTLGSGTVGTKTLTAAAYKCANAGTQGSTIIATAAGTVTATATELVFVITGTTLSPLDRVVLTLALAIQDTGGSNITAQINSIRLT